jgi:gas vesicle protein GvpA/GvpJ/GvpM family
VTLPQASPQASGGKAHATGARLPQPLEAYEPLEPYPPRTANLADILERILDKGIVIAGDIKIDLLDIELLTIRLRLFISSVDTAKKAGIDWWETEPALSTRAAHDALADENRRLREQVAELAGGEREEA